MYPKEKITSQFNEAAFQISRLHNIWNECRILRENGSLIKLKFKLDGAAIELMYDAKRLDEENKENGYVDQLKNIDQEILTTERSIIFKADKHEYFKQLYESLKEKEELLREIQEASGKGGKYIGDDDDGM